MAKDKQERSGKASYNAFVPEGMGSAHAISIDKKSSDKHEDKGKKHDAKGPPWGAEQSMRSACEEAGVNYDHFINAIHKGSDWEIAQELKVQPLTAKSLKERFYKMESTNGNVGQD
ncbi:MAG: hypothetical protein RBT41_05735 [Clostridia bacterium]|jgi:hypothetical protein|nr:hypothetical protein [Clostridia bacterium]